MGEHMIDDSFVVVMEKEYIGYPLYKNHFNVLEPYSHLKRGKIIRRVRDLICRVFNNPFFCFNDSLLNQNIKTYLIYDNVNPNIVKFIRQKNKEARIIIYYINPVNRSNDYRYYRSHNCEIWSFDEDDCKKYGLFWNPLHYFGIDNTELPDAMYDVFFVGADKGRYTFLKKMEEELLGKGLKCLFFITNDTNSPFYNHKRYSKRINYSTNLAYVRRSKAVLDIMQDGQSGFTMRIPESLVNHKKLITSNKRIKQYPFYCKDNIFILGEDDLDGIKEFINGQWNHCKDKEIEILTIESWFSRIYSKQANIK